MKVSYVRQSDLVKQAIARRLETRRENYLNALEGKGGPGRAVLIVGDKPGPSAPKDAGYHHTPFYSTKHCSGWLNACLELEGIPEERLIWVNSADKDGAPTDAKILDRMMLVDIIALGGNAEKWLKSNGVERFQKVWHPQAHKRFKNNERYELLDKLKAALG